MIDSVIGRVLVTGGCGFLGSRLCKRLLQLGTQVHVIVRPGSKCLRLQGDEGLVYHSADLAEPDVFAALLDKIAPKVLFNIAASGGYPGKRQRDLLFRDNVLVVHNLLMALEKGCDCRVVHASSSLENGPRQEAIREDMSNNPVTVYASTKTAATVLLRQAAVYDSYPITILRPFAIYGYGEASTRLIPKTIRAALSGEELSLTPPGYVRDYVFVEDVVDAFLMAANADNIFGEIINIGTGMQTSNEEVVSIISSLLRRSVRTNTGGYEPHRTDTTHWCANPDKARRLLGWVPQHDIRAGLEKTVKWFLEHEQRQS